jgi:cytoskeletal protein CcmA (bactofilin family)
MLFKKSQSIKFLQPTMESFETIVGPATEVHGRLVANESLRIDGSVIGNIEAYVRVRMSALHWGVQV